MANKNDLTKTAMRRTVKERNEAIAMVHEQDKNITELRRRVEDFDGECDGWVLLERLPLPVAMCRGMFCE